jgi:hypothetical protein
MMYVLDFGGRERRDCSLNSGFNAWLEELYHGALPPALILDFKIIRIYCCQYSTYDENT